MLRLIESPILNELKNCVVNIEPISSKDEIKIESVEDKINELYSLGLPGQAQTLKNAWEKRERKIVTAKSLYEVRKVFPGTVLISWDKLENNWTKNYDSDWENITTFEKHIYTIFLNSYTYRLKIISAGNYKGMFPSHIIKTYKEARDSKLFQTFHVMWMEKVKKLPDPLLLGRREGSEDFFVLAEWGKDLKMLHNLVLNQEE